MNPATDWIDQARRVLDAVRSNADGTGPGDGGEHAADCRWCPVCQVAAVVRGERPEVTAALADVLTATATALRSFAAAAEAASSPAAEDVQEEDPPSPVQWIEI